MTLIGAPDKTAYLNVISHIFTSSPLLKSLFLGLVLLNNTFFDLCFGRAQELLEKHRTRNLCLHSFIDVICHSWVLPNSLN
jgi:hypothetical protein